MTAQVKSEEAIRREWENRPVQWLGYSFAEYKAARAGAELPIAQASAEQGAKAKVQRPRHESGTMNKLEARYAEHLELRKRTGEVRAYEFEPMKLRLAKSTFLNVDFLVVLADGLVELHEVKGHWEDDARVKIKVAARTFPWWTFLGVQWDKQTKDWKYEVFDAR